MEVVLARIRAQAFTVEATAVDLTADLPDPDDAPFPECAKAAGVPLVRGNTRHYPRTAAEGMTVLSPAQFVASRRGRSAI